MDAVSLAADTRTRGCSCWYLTSTAGFNRRSLEDAFAPV